MCKSYFYIDGRAVLKTAVGLDETPVSRLKPRNSFQQTLYLLWCPLDTLALFASRLVMRHHQTQLKVNINININMDMNKRDLAMSPASTLASCPATFDYLHALNYLARPLPSAASVPWES